MNTESGDLPKFRAEGRAAADNSAHYPFDIALSYAHDPDTDFRGASHYALQICIVLHGRVEVLFQDFRRTYLPGEIWWNMCWEPYACRFAGSRNLVVAVHLDLERIGSCGPFGECNWLTPFLAPSEHRFLPSSPAGRKRAASLAANLFHLSRKQPDGWRTEIWLKLHLFLLQVIHSMADAHSGGDSAERSPNAFRRIRAVLNKVWTPGERPPSLSEAALLCSLSPSRFSDLFRSSMGVSYGRFVIRIRMTNAARDLLAGTMGIEEIARKWGFFDSAHFCHSFKKFYRISPGRYVEQSGELPNPEKF